jgi:DNA repair protein RadC
MCLFHSHPSGDPAPSGEDLEFTRRVADAGELLGVRLLDHIIFTTGGGFVSLQQRGAW